MPNNANMTPPSYYNAILQVGGTRYTSRWRNQAGQLTCIEADDPIAEWLKGRNIVDVLPKLAKTGFYIKFTR